MESVRELLDIQSGVIARSQLRARGRTAADLQRMLRRRELARVAEGVFVNHTGQLTWQQRAWVAVLRYAPAALHGVSALRAEAGPGQRGHDDAGPIHVAVDRHRNRREIDGVVLHRMVGLRERTRWSTSPPRVRVEEAVIDVAAVAASDFDAIAVIARAVGSRWTTPARLLAAVRDRPRLPRRQFLTEVLDDVEQGACSVLEVGFVRRVERPHQLPTGARQVRASSRGLIFRDVEYDGLGVVLELDGRLDHTLLRDRDRDLDRDIDAAIEQKVTARLGWGQVFGRPCRTAVRVHQLLSAHGHAQALGRCPDCA